MNLNLVIGILKVNIEGHKSPNIEFVIWHATKDFHV